jgi:hypothetical protein
MFNLKQYWGPGSEVRILNTQPGAIYSRSPRKSIVWPDTPHCSLAKSGCLIKDLRGQVGMGYIYEATMYPAI